MSRGKSFSCSTESISLCFLQIVMAVVLLLHHHHQTCDAITNNKTYCPPSSCGKITNIKHPFRLKNDPTSCGDPKYELSCENNITALTLFSGKYYVQEINYIDYTIRLVDPGIQEGNCSSIPRYFLSSYNITINPMSVYNDEDPYEIDTYTDIEPGHIIYLKCSKAVKDDPEYVDTAPCINSNSKSYLYAFAAAGVYMEDYEEHYFSVGRLKDYCQVKLVAMSSSDFPNVRVREGVPDRHRPLSYEEIHGMLLYGFQLSWKTGACRQLCGDNMKCDSNFITGDLECYADNEYCHYPLRSHSNINCNADNEYCHYPRIINCNQKIPKLVILVEDIIVGIIKDKQDVYACSEPDGYYFKGSFVKLQDVMDFKDVFLCMEVLCCIIIYTNVT